jgi:cytochrome P450
MLDGQQAASEYWRAPGEVYKAGDLWYITSYDAVREALRQPEVFSSGHAFDAISLGGSVPLIPLAIDPPKHSQYRRVLDPMLGPRRMKEFETRLRELVRGHIDAFADRGSCDVMAELAHVFPTQAILTLFGLPLEYLGQFRQWVDAMTKNANPNTLAATATNRQIEAGTALFTFIQQHVERKRDEPGDDMLSDILALTGEDAWTDAEILGLAFIFVLAGLDTVTGAIGFSMLRLAKDPAARSRLVNDPTLIPAFVEEMIRTEAPLPALPRVTTSDVEIAGFTIPAGSTVILVLVTANREVPNAAKPGLIELDRPTSHLGFGGGIHRCLGSHLARRELRLTIEEFHARIPEYELDGEPRIIWPSGTLHLASLPIKFAPTSAESP